MTKGKPWSVEEEKQLREMVQEHKRLSEIAGFFGESSASVKMKINRLKLVVVVRQIHTTTTSTELPSVEATLQVLAAALKVFSFLESLALEPEKGKGLRELLRF